MRFKPAPIQTYRSMRGLEIPICFNCGQFLVKDENWDTPEYCPRCGNEISEQIQAAIARAKGKE